MNLLKFAALTIKEKEMEMFNFTIKVSGRIIDVCVLATSKKRAITKVTGMYGFGVEFIG